MANCPTHIAIGTGVAGVMATLTLAADVVAPENLVAVTMAGVLGSVLPDIDLKDSRPSKAMFSGLAVFFAFVALFHAADKLSIAEMLLLWLGTLVFVRYGVKVIFHNYSYHRGIWHSIPAGLFCGCMTAIFYYYVLRRHEGVAWLAGGFMFVGYMTHLILDEIYSVDVMDTRIKQSFGTAVKIGDWKHPFHTAAMGVALVAAFMMGPPTRTFVDGISSQAMWVSLHRKLLPAERDRWFGVDFGEVAERWRPRRAAVTEVPPSAAITTGALPEPAAPAKKDGD
jgi:membrane-bound metal-dependent hydrolase YbcI (DUF457 family)